MLSIRQSRFRAFILAAIVAAGAAIPCFADTVYDCFEVKLYRPSWHVKSTLDGFTDKIDIAIDDNLHNGWEALYHGSMSVCYLAGASAGETVDADTFAGRNGKVEFPDQSDFIVAFAIGCSGGKSIDGYFGWFRAAYEGGTIVLKGGALNTERGGSITAGIEEPASDLDWRTVDHGDWLELAENCIPPETTGRVVIPRQIDGKPVTAVGEAAFYGCSQITSLQIPNSVSNIGYKAFSGCSAITTLSIPSSVTNMDAAAFRDCLSLQTLSLHGPATIVEDAVRELPALGSIEFGKSVRTIKAGAVVECPNLASLSIPGDVVLVEPGAFVECPLLKSVAVHWLTKADASSFPDGCEITRYGIDHLPSRFFNEPPLTDAEVLQFVEIVGRDVLVGISWLSWSTRPIGDTSLRGVDRTCIRLGLYPSSYTTYSGPYRYFYWARPAIRVVEFDHEKRRITLKVDPPEGSHVAALPMLDYFHLIGIQNFGTENQSEVDIPLSAENAGFSEYISGNGLFTLTYGETDAQFLYLRIADK